jgi:hypothetical protein
MQWTFLFYCEPSIERAIWVVCLWLFLSPCKGGEGESEFSFQAFLPEMDLINFYSEEEEEEEEGRSRNETFNCFNARRLKW